MNKLCVLLYAIAVFGLSYYGLSSHSYYVQLLINLDRPYMFVRATLIIALTVYAFIPWLRISVTKALLGIGGVALLSLGLTAICSPSLLGHLNTWMLPGDSIMLIEGGILAVVLSAELPARRTKFMAKGYTYVQLLLSIQLRRLVYSTTIVPDAIQGTTLFERVLGTGKAFPVLEELVRGSLVVDKVPLQVNPDLGRAAKTI